MPTGKVVATTLPDGSKSYGWACLTCPEVQVGFIGYDGADSSRRRHKCGKKVN